jgi:hypothetical protein
MFAQKSLRSLFIAVLVFAIQSSHAVAPIGAISIPIDPTVAPVYDLNTTVSPSHSIIGSGGALTPMSYDLPLSMDASGRITSAGGPVVLTVGDSAVASDVKVSGRISGGGGNVTKVNITVKLSGEDIVAGVSTPFKVTITYNLKIDPTTLTLVGTARGNAKFTKLNGGGNIKEDVSIPLPTGIDGSWTAQMDILPLTGLSGTGSFVLSTTRSLSANLSGTYSSKTDVAKVKMTGINEGKGSSVNIDFTTSDTGSTLQKLRGRVSGQTVKQ